MELTANPKRAILVTLGLLFYAAGLIIIGGVPEKPGQQDCWFAAGAFLMGLHSLDRAFGFPSWAGLSAGVMLLALGLAQLIIQPLPARTAPASGIILVTFGIQVLAHWWERRTGGQKQR
ncbi:MAG TPA: hypothetical protein VNQ79_03240 [Blastocatellia bacterium]|nr:hypothetical protein [Blastocatellia bacterium]